MSKRAEEAALKAYPVQDNRKKNLGFSLEYSYILHRREAFQEGYEQAEKDYIELAQLWVDSGDANIMSFKQFLKCYETQSNK